MSDAFPDGFNFYLIVAVIQTTMKITIDDYHVNDDDDVDDAEHVLYRLHETRNHRRKQF